MKPLSKQYLIPLQKWVKSLKRSLYFPAGRDDIACCGMGDHGHWSLQTNTTTMSALAVLSQAKDLDEAQTGMTRDQLLDYALRLLRFTLRSHKSGPETAFDGEKWGCHWISVLCVDRMMHAIEAMEDHLTEKDQQMLRNMLVMESNFLTDDYEVVGAIDALTGKNHPESNIWNGNILFRTAMMYPAEQRAGEYRAKANSYLLNGISVPADADDNTLIDGKKIKEWHIGPNFTENMALHHHAYLNVGYMVICMSNIAMMHFSCKHHRIEPPAALYHHVMDLWRMIKLCTFPDGRLWRIGGDTRVRYAYCQDYAIPMWLMMRDEFGEDCDAMERDWLSSVAKEQSGNPDGSFMKARLQELAEASPLYFHRLEGDKGVTLSMGAYWRSKYNDFENKKASSRQAPLLGDWHDEFHGAVVAKGKNRCASWVWEATQRPVGQCVPSENSDLAEWRWNLAGTIEGMGFFNEATRESNKEWSFPGGFCTSGSLVWISDNFIAEGQSRESTAREKIAVAALPDDATMIVMQQAQTLNRVILKTVKGLQFNVPNDLFNNFIHKYHTEKAEFSLIGLEAENKTIKTGSQTLSIDEKINIEAISGIKEICIYRPGKRQVCIFGKPASQGRSGGNLYCDEICHPCSTTRRSYDKGEVLFDQAFAISIGNKTLAEEVKTENDNVKAVKVTGADGKTYQMVANFADSVSTVEIPAGNKTYEGICGNPPEIKTGEIKLNIPPLETVLLASK